MQKVDIDKINCLANKMGILSKTEETTVTNNIGFSKMLDISKPNRPDIKIFFQRQLDMIGEMLKNKI